jgi:tetratricopeptide (TPR) repeat protein
VKARRRDRRALGVAIVLGVLALVSAGVALDASREPAGAPEAAIGARFAQGVADLQSGDPAQAAAAFEAVLAMDPAIPEAHVNRGFALLELGRAGDAATAFDRAIMLRPSQANAYFGLGEAREALGDREAARGAMRAYLHLAAPQEAFRRRAEAALWEWGAAGEGLPAVARRP